MPTSDVTTPRRAGNRFTKGPSSMTHVPAKSSQVLAGQSRTLRPETTFKRHWHRITGLPGWKRAQLGLPAFGDADCTTHLAESQLSEADANPLNMKIAIPTEDGHLHEHFGGCRQFAVVEVDEQTRELIRTEIVPAPEHQPGLFPRWLRAQGVAVVIVGGVGRRALANFAQHGITVRAGLPGESLEAQVTALLEGRLTQSPEDCGQDHDHHHHHHHHGHGHHHQDHLTHDANDAGTPPTEPGVG